MADTTDIDVPIEGSGGTRIGSFTLEPRTGRVRWSQGMRELLGVDGEDDDDTDASLLLDRVHPDDRRRMAVLLDAVVNRTETLAEDLLAHCRILLDDGTQRDLRIQARLERDRDGTPARWIALAGDVSAELRGERQLAAHYAVSQALRDWESFEEGVVGLLRRLGTALDCEVGLLWTWDEDRDSLQVRASWSAEHLDAASFEAATRDAAQRHSIPILGTVWATEQPVVVGDLTKRLPLPRREAAQAIGLRSGIALVAHVDDGPVAMLSFYSKDHREASELLLRTLTALGWELGRFLSRRRAELDSRPLSPRELEVLRLATEGLTGPAIAERLVLSPATVKTHFENIYEKLGVGDRAAAVAHALRTGLIA